MFLQKKNIEIKNQDGAKKKDKEIQDEQIDRIKFVFEEIFKGKNFKFLTNDLTKNDLENPEMYSIGVFYQIVMKLLKYFGN
jgi:hypothetical protein